MKRGDNVRVNLANVDQPPYAVSGKYDGPWVPSDGLYFLQFKDHTNPDLIHYVPITAIQTIEVTKRSPRT